jgi:nucleotide-binding universal stress UspA family protein
LSFVAGFKNAAGLNLQQRAGAVKILKCRLFKPAKEASAMLKSKVLLPSDGSSTSLKAAAYAVRLMKMNKDMKLSVLVVLPGDSILVNSKNGGENIMEPLAREIQDRGREILQKTVEIFSNEGLSVDGLIDRGDPAEVILAHAERDNFDHIIMGSRGVSELRGVELGSVSHKVIHLANCRVTLVK